VLRRAAEVLALQSWARQALFLQVAYAAVHMSGVALQQRDGASQGRRGRVRRGQAGPWAREASAKAVQRRRVVAVEAGTSWARPRGQRLSASLRVRSAGSVLAWWGKRSGDEMDGRIPWDSGQVQVLVQGPDEGTTDR